MWDAEIRSHLGKWLGGELMRTARSVRNPRLVQTEVGNAVLAFVYRKNNKHEVFRDECDRKLDHSAY